MKTQTLIATFSLVLGLATLPLAQAAGNHGHQPKHGGVVTEAKYGDYELVAKPTSIQLHLRDHGNAPDISKASAKLTLLSGAEKQELVLTPAGDKFEAAGSFKVAPGTKAVAVITVPGRSAVSVRFVLK